MGQACSCVAAIHGDHVLRTDGTVVHYGGLATVIEEGDTGVPLTGMTEIFRGQHHGCGRRDDGTVWCWRVTSSGNNFGQLGNGALGGGPDLHHATAVEVAPADGGGLLTGVEHINVGASRCYIASTTCAVLSDGTLWCWGEGGDEAGSGEGFFNDGPVGSHAYATPIMADPVALLDDVQSVSLGTRHACVDRSGEMWCWGTNVGGPLGQGNQIHQVYPVLVPLPGDVDQIAAGSDVSCARIGDGVYCWGANTAGQVGIGDPAMESDGCINFCKLDPEAVLGEDAMPLTGVVDLNSVYLGNCVVRDDATLWCWGSGTTDVASPLQVVGNPVTDVVLQSSCGSGNVPVAIRYLDDTDELYSGALVVPQICG